MKRTPRHLTSILLTALVLATAAAGLAWLPAAGSEPAAKAAVQVAQSTSAILEGRAA